jgi:hypothetical protein
VVRRPRGDDRNAVMTPPTGMRAKFRRVELRRNFTVEHIMGMHALRNRRWTAADVRALMDESRPWPRYELLDGELLVTNAPSVAHHIAVSDLLTRIGTWCEDTPVGLALASPADLEL